MTERKTGCGKGMLYVFTWFAVFLTIYTLGLRIAIFATAWDISFQVTGWLDWYKISIISCGIVGLLMFFSAVREYFYVKKRQSEQQRDLHRFGNPNDAGDEGSSVKSEQGGFHRKYIDCILLAGILLWLVASAFINRDLSVTESLAGAVDIGVTVVCFYLAGRLLTRAEMLYVLRRVLLFGSFVWNIGCIISLAFYIVNYQGYFKFAGFIRTSRQGIMEGRLFGCFSDPNYAAVISMLLMVGMLLMYHELNIRSADAQESEARAYNREDESGSVRAYANPGEKSKGRILTFGPNIASLARIYIYFSIGLYVLYIVLSGSRSTQVALLSTAVVLVTAYNMQHKVSIKEYILRPLLAVIALVAVYFVLLFAMQGIGYLVSPERDLETEFDRDDVSEENLSNGRLQIWTEYLSFVTERPIFGFGTRGALTEIRKNHPESYVADKGYNPHSMFVQMVVQGGYSAFLLMMAFFILIFIRVLRRVRAGTELSPLTWTAIAWVGIHVIFCIFNVGIFITPCVEAMFAWLGMGWLATNYSH